MSDQDDTPRMLEALGAAMLALEVAGVGLTETQRRLLYTEVEEALTAPIVQRIRAYTRAA